MSDETNAQAEAPARQEETPQATDWKAEARKWEDRSKANHAELEQARSALAAAEDAARRAQEQAGELEARVSQESTLRVKEHLLMDAGLPRDLASNIVGDDEEAWRGSVERFAALRAPSEPVRTQNPAQSGQSATPSDDEVGRAFFGL